MKNLNNHTRNGVIYLTNLNYQRKDSTKISIYTAVNACLLGYNAICASALKKEAGCSSETLSTIKFTYCYNPRRTTFFTAMRTPNITHTEF
jgi:hypothetical protein